jgi:hypothetical protein
MVEVAVVGHERSRQLVRSTTNATKPVSATEGGRSRRSDSGSSSGHRRGTIGRATGTGIGAAAWAVGCVSASNAFMTIDSMVLDKGKATSGT